MTGSVVELGGGLLTGAEGAADACETDTFRKYIDPAVCLKEERMQGSRGPGGGTQSGTNTIRWGAPFEENSVISLSQSVWPYLYRLLPF
jgi:hypothetical protein